MRNRIGIDVRLIESSGIGTTIKGLLNFLPQEVRKGIFLYGHQEWKNPYPEYHFRPVPYPIYSLRQHWAYSSFLKKENIHLFHMPHFDIPLGYSKPFVSTIHDLIHVKFPQYSRKPFSRLYAKTLISHVAKRAKTIFTVSQNTKKDILEFFPQSENKIKVIYPGVSSDFKNVSPPQAQPVWKKKGVDPGFILYVGNIRGSKNILTLLAAYQMLKKHLKNCPPLVLVGKSTIKIMTKFKEGVIFLGEVEQKELPAIYSGALFFVFPSIYEGFGLPPLEAMSSGVPVISSNSSSLPEVCGDAAEYFNPRSASELCEKMKYLCSNKDRRMDLIIKGKKNVQKFTWSRFSSEIWEEYNRVIEGLDK